jgi:hypothetical protein
MSDTPTPETDAFMTRIRGIDGDKHWVPVDTAKRLERERDEAMRQLDNLKASSIHTCHDQCQRPMCVLRRERDEAREEVRKLKIILDMIKAESNV